jgi:polysaccharide export outer membrane protein
MRDGKVLSPNPLIEDGDVIVIPTRYPTVVYVLGDVQRAGAFQLNTDERLMVSQAVAMAGGPGRTAKVGGGFLVRYGPDGTRQQLPVDFSAIMQGRQRDFEVLPNDVIFIPGSKAKTLQFATLGAIPGVVASIPVQD